MKKLLLILLLPVFLANCKGKKVKLADDDDTVVVADFVDFFPDVKLPYFATDSSFSKKESDSSRIGNKIFSQFVPDSVIKKEFGTAKPALFPIGKVHLKNAETYLFVKAYSSAKSAALLIAFDKDNHFIASLPLVVQDKNSTLARSGGMDSKYVVTKTVEKKGGAEQYNEEKTVYILNSEAKEFSIIMSDMGIEEGEQDIINPIDTLARKQKYSGDYTRDKRNIISIRDGKNAGKLAFFVHFEKENGSCMGELKGEAELRSPKIAIYRAQGNPCELEFLFEGNKVTIREAAACGSYRDIKCFFEGSFSRKKK